MNSDAFDAEPALAQLKRFQRKTVDYVFERLHGVDQARHFLVADEVGLGKTMVARGVIAKTVEKLWANVDRIDILYICSNQAIAGQNLNKLNVLGTQALSLPTRMTLVPLHLRDARALGASKVNFVSLTPGTTFNLCSTTGVLEERALLLRLLEPYARFTPLRNALQVGAGDDNWDRRVADMSLEGLDQSIVRRFRETVAKDQKVISDLAEVCGLFARRRPHYPEASTQARNALIGELRKLLSHACVRALKPDLIILDEFQRFRELLQGDGEAAELAQALFEYSDGATDTRTLLLSATPYKMLTLSDDDPDEGDHYADFLATIGFLHGRERGAEVAVELDREMKRFRAFLQRLPAGKRGAKQARSDIERSLRRVMSRTERVDSTRERDSMVTEPAMEVCISPTDLRQAVAMSKLATAADAPGITEYWKSAPYLLNFMRDYTLKRRLKEPGRATRAVVEALADAESLALKRDVIEAYRSIDPGNGRLRALMADLFGADLDQQLWLPPSLPYYGPNRPSQGATKALVFSEWQMVPDALAALLSYEAERRMGLADGRTSYSAATKLRPLQFRIDRGRPTALRTLNLLYPSPTLARVGDPLALFSGSEERPSLDDMRAAVRESLADVLRRLPSPSDTGPSTSRDWEWALAASIDVALGSPADTWLEPDGASGQSSGESGFKEHVLELRRISVTGEAIQHDDSALDLLVDVALGSPAVCAVRALRRIAPELDWHDPPLLNAASSVAYGFRTLFNQHDAIALLRQESEEHYWRSVLLHCATHNLQAVLDEYAHYLLEGEGLVGAEPSARVAGVAKAMVSALSIRPSQIEVDDVGVEDGRVVFRAPISMRGRFAMRLAELKDEEGGVVRLASVREAFNSPFRPFVLATTSIGQEGLDFHPYCHRVYHWNLPGNPVDLEQREGRVHRFKGHAVRLNVAAAHADAVRKGGRPPTDPWAAMFEAARRATRSSDELVPYWVFEGPTKVERRVPLLPFSREVTRLAWLKRSLTLYRLAFGQPRQDDLLAHLARLLGADADASMFEDLQIRLHP